MSRGTATMGKMPMPRMRRRSRCMCDAHWSMLRLRFEVLPCVDNADYIFSIRTPSG